jgi:hypothetical protein
MGLSKQELEGRGGKRPPLWGTAAAFLDARMRSEADWEKETEPERCLEQETPDFQRKENL